MIYTVKGFSIVNETKIDVFWNSLAFSMIRWILAIWSLVPLPFLNPACTYGSSQFTYSWVSNSLLLAQDGPLPSPLVSLPLPPPLPPRSASCSSENPLQTPISHPLIPTVFTDLNHVLLISFSNIPILLCTWAMSPPALGNKDHPHLPLRVSNRSSHRPGHVWSGSECITEPRGP